MWTSWTVVGIALGYLGLLFAIASYGDRLARRRAPGTPRPVIYALSLGVYCTSWTFFGSVGLAAHSGLDFLPIYIGPILMLALGWRFLHHVVDLSKRHNITSMADFIAARYGKNQTLGAIIAIIAVLGTIPYISLQLKAVSTSLETLLLQSDSGAETLAGVPILNDLALMVAGTMAVFATLFGTRHIDATEHQNGLIMAIAAESVVKLLAFLVVGVFVTFFMFSGPGDLLQQAREHARASTIFDGSIDPWRWITMTLLSCCAIMLLPRQFHVAVVENTSPSDVRKAAWLFPLYLVAINIFVVPIAVAGLLVFREGAIEGDMFVLALPMAANEKLVSLIAFVGGLSAATAMVIVAAIALAIMVCNDIVVPAVVRKREMTADAREDMGQLLLNIRRAAIFGILGLAYLYYRLIADSFALASIGLLSFAAIAQFAPAFFGGLVWRRATARGAIAGILVGFGLWIYTLLLPSLVDSGWLDAALLEAGPFGIAALRPRMLLGLEADPLTHGVIWSLACNVAAYVVGSLVSSPQPIERLQANSFVATELPASSPSFRLWRTSVTVGDLRATVARYLGEDRTERAFNEFADTRNVPINPDTEADVRLVRFAEHLLASAVGAASSRLVLALLLERRSPNRRGALKLLDDASAAIQHNRDLLQSAIDHVRHGIAVFDRDLRLTCWNRQFRHLLLLPAESGRVGVPLPELLRLMAESMGFDDAETERFASDRITKLLVDMEPYQERLEDGTVLEVRSDSLPDGGIVLTFADITERVASAEALQRAKETLERRVEEPTRELVKLNAELARAKAQAEEANLGKTRFLAAASHDILQPLNAARLYTSSLIERNRSSDDAIIIRNIDASLEAVEEILVALLDISRLDTGVLKPEFSVFRLDELFTALELEFAPMAREKGLALKVLPCSLAVRSDRRLLRRVLQNLVANAVKYTEQGTVLMGCRRCGDRVRVEVHDTGAGIPESKQKLIFQEFQRLDAHRSAAPGLGLGLSIVERIGHVLDHPIAVASTPDRGSVFSIEIPVARQAAVPAPPARAAPAAWARLEGAVVMCVDNEQSILDGMTQLLGGWGCRVLTAKSSREALALLEAGERIDILLADYHLDGEDGITLIETARKRLGEDLQSILITADHSRDLQSEAAKLGLGYMNKPVRPAALRAVISQARIRAHAAE